MNAVRLIIAPPARGTWNMAVDEALVESAAAGVTTLRFYQWSEPTLSLGYFQAAADRDVHVASRGCPLVRRTSGGGAILHDRELTYSYAAPIRHRLGAQADAVYDLFHQSLIETLGELGVVAQRCDERPPASPASPPPFLCFQRRTPGDVLCGGVKIAGSAQRRQRGGLLQHGSILLAQSPAAPELPGIAEVAARAFPAEQLAEAWAAGLSRLLSVELERAGCGGEELERAARIERDRFGANSWTFRR